MGNARIIVARPTNNTTLRIGLIQTHKALVNITTRASGITPDEEAIVFAEHLIPESNIVHRKEVSEDMQANSNLAVFSNQRVDLMLQSRNKCAVVSDRIASSERHIVSIAIVPMVARGGTSITLS